MKRMYARQNARPRTVNGPYKATNIWNEIVYAFRAGLPTRRHRRNLRFHDDCFAASDAVDWLLAYLNRNPTFGIVSRYQTVQLLGKFLKSNVIEDVRGGNVFTANQFLDNKDLYRFTRFSPTKFPRSPLKTCTNTTSTNSSKTVKQKVPLEHRKSVLPKLQSPKTPHWQQLPSVIEVENIWRKSLVEKMDSVMSVLGGSDSERDIFDGVFVNAKRVIHNSTRIGQSGIVDSLDRSLELPHWVLSAMKCLITWPKASGVESCLPNYPGFERDVFNVVRDYFEKLDEPLIAVSLYNVLTTVYVLVEQFDASLRRANGITESKRDTPWTAHAVDALGERMSKALCIVDGASERDQPPRPILDVNVAVSCPNLAANSKVVSSDKLMNTFLCFETDFETDSPVTNIVHPSNNASRPIRTESVVYIGQPEVESPRCSSVDSALNWHGGHHARKINGVDDRESVLNVLLNESGGYVNLACNEMTSAVTSGRCESADPDQEGYVNLGCTELSNDEEPPLCLVASCDIVKSDIKKERAGLRRSASSSTLSTHAELMEARTSDIWTWNPTDKCLRRYGSDPDIRTAEGKKLAVEAVRLCLLLLPPDNRRNLHRLLRFMLRMSDNKQLQLDIYGLPNRKLVLNTFGRCLLRPVCEPDDLDDGFTSRFVAFLVDNQDGILEAPLDLIASVDAQLATIEATKKLKHRGDAAFSVVRSLTYCEQVSEAEFERQKRSVSQRAVADLLDGIVADTRLCDHEKRKKLKQFKKMYPEIYADRFPSESEPPAGIKRSAPASFKKPFQRLLEMRL